MVVLEYCSMLLCVMLHRFRKFNIVVMLDVLVSQSVIIAHNIQGIMAKQK